MGCNQLRKPANDQERLRDASEQLGEKALDMIGKILLKHHMGILEGSREAIFDAVLKERERIITLLNDTEFTSLEHMPHEAATLIRQGEISL